MRSIALLTVTLCLLAGCGSSSDSDPGGDAGDADVVYLRGLNAVSNGPDLRLSVDGTALDDVEYGAATALQRRSLGSGTTAVLNVQARAVAPGGIGLPLADAAVTVNGDTEVGLIVTGAFPAAEVIAVPAPRRSKPVDGLYFQFAHAANAAGALDVHLTDPAVDLTATAPFARLAPGEYSDSEQVPFQAVRVRLTTSNTLDVVFDSGTLNFVDNPDSTLDGREWLVAIADNPAAGSSPLKLLMTDGKVNELRFDREAPSAVRVVLASPNAPPMDVVVGDGFALPLASALAYGGQSALAAVRAGRVSLNFTPPGDPSQFLFEHTLATAAGLQHTLFLMGPFAAVDGRVSEADGRSVATESRLRLVNAAPDSEFFTLYVSDELPDAGELPPATDIVGRDLRYGQMSDYLGLATGTSYLTLTERFYETDTEAPEATESITIGPLPFEALGGQVSTLLILPGQTGATEDMLLLDDLAP